MQEETASNERVDQAMNKDHRKLEHKHFVSVKWVTIYHVSVLLPIFVIYEESMVFPKKSRHYCDDHQKQPKLDEGGDLIIGILI